MGKTKLTKLEKNWILYDVGNSAFTMLVTAIVPIYFNSLGEAGGLTSVQYLAYWGYAASIATLIVAFIGPVFGTIADTKGFKKPLFFTFMLVGILGCIGMAVPKSWLAFLIIFVIAKVGYNSSLVFYDAMLPDVTTPDRMDMVSSHGYAWGYIGSCIPFIGSLLVIYFYKKIGITFQMAMALAFAINAVWWLLMTLPLLRNYKQTNYVELKAHAVRNSFLRLGRTFKEMKQQKKIFLYFLAFFFYIDGVYTIISMATSYGTALGLNAAGLLLALLVTQIVAFPCAILFGRLAKNFATEKLIKVCILAYTAIAIFGIQLDKQWEFWVLAVAVGMFQGAVQALSRSYLGKIIPAEKAGEYFGIFDICGKGASFMGTFLVGFVAQLTGSANSGVAVLAVMFLIGYFIFGKSAKM